MAEDPNSTPPKPNWIDTLAKRSTGLPADETSRTNPAPASDKTLYRMAGLGLQFAATVAIFAILGREADKHFGWTPWGVISFTLIAVVGNLYLLIKESMLENSGRPQPGKARKKQ